MTVDYSKFDNIVDSDDEKPQASSSPKSAPPVVEKPHCYNCHKDVAKPLRCSICKVATYCSAQCQKEDWKYHKRVCKKPEEAKPKASPEKKAPASEAAREERRKQREEEKVVDNDENLTWYRHREWKPTVEPKKEFTPTPITEQAAAEAATESAKPKAGSAWNAAGTWEEKDVTAFAQQGLKDKLSSFANIDVAGGALSAEDVDAVDGDASKPVIRGKLRHIFDLSFKVKFVFKWMDSSGQRQAQGVVEVHDFTNDVFAEGALTPPEVRVAFGDGRLLDTGRKQAVELAIGSAEWPPAPSSLMGQVAERMRAWADEYQQAA